MNLDPDICYRALTARDSRFDGVFFVGVLSTRIYCRPICPARTPGRSAVGFTRVPRRPNYQNSGPVCAVAPNWPRVMLRSMPLGEQQNSPHLGLSKQ